MKEKLAKIESIATKWAFFVFRRGSCGSFAANHTKILVKNAE